MIGLFLEEFVPGQRIDLGSHLFTRAAILAFARNFDPVDFHVDDEAAARGPFGRLTAAGLHTAAGWMTCYVATNTAARAARAAEGKTLPALGPSPGFSNMRWLEPVFVDDVLTFSSTITSARLLNSRPGWGLLAACNEGINQHGKLVFSFESIVLTQSRNGGTAT